MGGSLLVSYSANSDDRGDLIYADAYRPKFIRTPITAPYIRWVIQRHF
jgi:hypothetical protein